ncbi:rhoptry-associated protein 1 beta1 [Plakobranchus ocellatus]|uniref:Rhoptry-associated protein 1 beta1 n=1 Tax=Plakobranchus ocellatus TaxID=259542 RepID=A0AAV4B1W2_9GAST|nr:rhoptry-associated protein 1 beta1 [Plakobranchus ocellatus]
MTSEQAACSLKYLMITTKNSWNFCFNCYVVSLKAYFENNAGASLKPCLENSADASLKAYFERIAGARLKVYFENSSGASLKAYLENYAGASVKACHESNADARLEACLGNNTLHYWCVFEGISLNYFLAQKYCHILLISLT